MRQQRAAVEEGLAGTVTVLAALIDNQLETSIKSLETLATARSLDRGDLAAFYEEAHRVRALHGWSTVGLIDGAGAHRLNTARPLGAPLPDLRDREYFKQVVATGKPYVSDLLKGRAIPTVDVGVAVPVRREGQLRYVLFAGVDPERFAGALQAQRLPIGALASIVSRDGVFVARDQNHAGTVGRALPAAYLAQIRQASSGRLERVTLEGVEMVSAYRRMTRAGWTVDFGMPADAVIAPVRRIAWLGTLVGSAIVLGALALALTFARRMARDIGALGAAASALGRELPAGAPPLRVAELEAMRHSVAIAGEILRERERQDAELLTSERVARADAESANRLKDEFIAIVSHELRTPLTSAHGWVRLLQRGGVDEDGRRKGLEVIARSVDQQLRIVSDLLDASALMAGRLALERQRIDLAELVRGELEAFRTTATGQGVHLVDLLEKATTIDADPARVTQILSNLVGNALKFTPAGGRVEVHVYRVGAEAWLVVKDTGSGIEPDFLPYVFDKFRQAQAMRTRRVGGMGLGLAIVRSLVELHGGTVSAESAGAEKGATFSVRFPLAAA